MKKIILMALAVMPFMGMAQEQSYTVIAKVARATPANEAHLLYYEGTTPKYATAKLENGQYTFKGVAFEPVQAAFFLDGDGFGYKNGNLQDKLNLRLENGEINIVAADSVRTAKVTGGTYNKDLELYKSFTTKATNAIEKQNALAIQAAQNKEPKETQDAIRQKLMAAGDAWKKRNLEYAKTHPDSYSSISAISFTMGMNVDLTVYQPIYDGLTARLKATPAGKELLQKLDAARVTKIGAMAPLFTQADTSGKQIGPKDFRGKYLLLDFWASWCGPCRAENPNYIANYKKYHDKGFEMLGVSLDKEGDKKQWIAAIHKDGLLWPQVSDLKYWNGDVTKLYGIRAIPQNFLIDPQGKIIASNLRGEDLSKKLAELFDK